MMSFSMTSSRKVTALFAFNRLSSFHKKSQSLMGSSSSRSIIGYNTQYYILHENTLFRGKIKGRINNRRYISKLLCSNHLQEDPNNRNVAVENNNSANNEYLVQARNQARMEKNQTRQKSLDEDRQRNLRIKRLLHTDAATTSSENSSTSNNSNGNNNNNNNNGGFTIPNMYAIRVSVDKELREKLRMNGREKRGRVFIEDDTEGCTTLKGLKFELHAFFRCLKKSTYLLSASMPEILEDGSIFSPGAEDGKVKTDYGDGEDDDCMIDQYANFHPIESDDDVIHLFEQAQRFFEDHNSKLSSDASNRLKRPSLLLHVRKDPNAPKPPPPPAYLENMANPNDTESMTMLSFYSFPPNGIQDAEEFGLFLRKVWKPFNALGRVYVAKEGVNAQMSIPTNVLANFRQCCTQIPELGSYMENGINIDPIPLTMEEFAVSGDMDGKPVPPFKNLHVRVRQQIVADGLDNSLNWEDAGYDMPPLEWHKKLKEARERRKSLSIEEGSDGSLNNDVPLIFDCRNDYETSVGKFEGAIPLNTTNFRDSWEVLKEQLKDKPKDAPIMTYCTGGIRCVKVGAYLSQELGFTNVSRLAGGIIAYDRTLTKESPEEEPMFKGTNYVFDGRLGRQITEDALGECISCGTKTHLVSNCRNTNCHKRMVQCINCRDSFVGTCSHACKHRLSNDKNLGVVNQEPVVESRYDNVDDYSLGHSTPPPAFYSEIEKNTAHFIGSGLHMLSDSAQGRLLKSLTAISRDGRVLEIGGFTGYATSCFLEGAADAAEVIDNNIGIGCREGGAFVMSLERDQRAIDLAAFHVGSLSRYGNGEEASEVLSRLRTGDATPPMIEDNVVSFTYQKAGCEIVRVTDALAFVEAVASGIECASMKPFDIVFIDADKTRFLEYVEACLTSNRLLKKGGLMIVDNVLWKGVVLDICGAADISQENEELGKNKDEIKKSRRARKLANAVHSFNRAVVQDERVEVFMLPIRDGLSVIRKK